MRTFLFDIDGTLVHTGGAGGLALLRAFRYEFGVEEPANVAFSGRTDRAIVRNLFELHGIPDTAENWQRLRESYLELLPASLEERQGRVLDGVHELLQRLEQQEALLGLLTGNLREGARIKLSFYGLFRKFAFGGFGDDHYDRDDVARAAAAEAAKLSNGRYDHSPVWVIGDTPLDVQCARAIGAHVLAVGTGIHSREELDASGPDALVDTLADTEEILRIIGFSRT